jgi:hypothetical protein
MVKSCVVHFLPLLMGGYPQKDAPPPKPSQHRIPTVSTLSAAWQKESSDFVDDNVPQPSELLDGFPSTTLYEAIAQNEPALHGNVVDGFGQYEPNGHAISTVEPGGQ